jgi:hypothetical protein
LPSGVGIGRRRLRPLTESGALGQGCRLSALLRRCDFKETAAWPIDPDGYQQLRPPNDRV